MECFLRNIVENKSNEESHRYFVRFGKGQYDRRFLMSFNKSEKIKVKTSFEFANDLVNFVNGLGNKKFSGKVFTKEKMAGMEGKKKGSVFLYEISDSGIDNFDKVYFYLLDCEDKELTLKIKKSLPKPGKDAQKIDDGFCTLVIDAKYWQDLKSYFFWDVPDCKKAVITHTLKINDIIFPKGEKDPVKIRELAKRKGFIIKKMNLDGKETEKEYPIEA